MPESLPQKPPKSPENSPDFNEGNLGAIAATQFEEYKKFLDMVRAYTPNGMLH